MARRAGFFKLYKDTAQPHIIISGPNEFLADDAERFSSGSPDEAEAKKAITIYKHLPVTAGMLSGNAQRWLKEKGGGTPKNFSLVTTAPVTRTVESAIGRIGIVFFPESAAKKPTPGEWQAVLDAGKKLRGKTRLVIGVSPWGYLNELEFLPKAQGVFSCLFGGGEGVAFGQVLTKTAPGVLWIRPDTEGRSVNVVELFSLPPSGPMQWTPDKTFSAFLELLGPSTPPLPAITKIVGTSKSKR